MVTTTPVSRKRCGLCLAILEVVHVSTSGEVVTVRFDQHTDDTCAIATTQRIKVLEEMHARDSMQLESQSQAIDEIGRWIGAANRIIEAGKKWLALRTKRAADLTRLRNAFGTVDRANHHPLWAAESEVAESIEAAIHSLEKRGSS